MKTCVTCLLSLPKSQFYKYFLSKDGLNRQCKDCIKKYRIENPDKIKLSSAKTYQKFKEVKIIEAKEYRKANKLEILDKARKRYQENPEKFKSRIYAYKQNKLKSDPYFRLTENLRRRLSLAISSQKSYKQEKTFELIGCSPSFFRSYLESLFQEGMTWENYGIYGWHVDHIKPCSSFDLSDPAQQKECFHYTNCQPLWAQDNLKKSDSL